MPRLSELPSNISPEEEYRQLCEKAKGLCQQGEPDDIRKALKLFRKAQKLHNGEKLEKRIHKLEKYLKSLESDSDSDEEEEGDQVAHVGDGFYLYKPLYDNLYAHQRQGVLFLYRLYKLKRGGILGDDMGLGKTIQVCAYLSGMFDARRIKSALIVLPVAVIMNWSNEFEKWAPGLDVYEFHSQSKKEKEKTLLKIQRKGGICLTSYGIVVSSAELLSTCRGQEFVWDYVILDEGHKIKNPSTKSAKGVHSIPSRNRIVLSGTPLMNNLKELWALYDWTHEGQLLGTARTFGMNYESHITRSRQKDATAGEQRLGAEMAQSLHNIIAPYFLRRTKADVHILEKKGGGTAPAMPTLTRKNDLICWVFLSETQQKIYKDFKETPEVIELLNTSKSPLVALTILKKICDHPRLLTNRQCEQLGMSIDSNLDLDAMDRMIKEDNTMFNVNHIPDDVLISESGKLVFLVELLDNLKKDGHRCLVFSQSRKVLDIIQKIMKNRGHRICRLDGTIRKIEDRQLIIEKFTNNPAYSIFLLTTQVGGVGLTLTAADRVVIYDPSWNPATDSQAVDRAFRIGQDKNVVIYRLITCGSVEEKIYRRQIFKDSINRTTTGDSKNPIRYFSKQELYQLFELDDPHVSETQKQLSDLHLGKRKSDTNLDNHIAFLHSLEIAGISDHDLMFVTDAVNDSEDEEDVKMGKEYIKNCVATAQQLLSKESEDNKNLAKQLGKYPGGMIDDPRGKSRIKSRDGIEDGPPPPREKKLDLPNRPIKISSTDFSDDERFSPLFSTQQNMMSSTTYESESEFEQSMNGLALDDGRKNINDSDSDDDDDTISQNDRFHMSDTKLPQFSTMSGRLSGHTSSTEARRSVQPDEEIEKTILDETERYEDCKEPPKSPYVVVKEELIFSPRPNRPLIDVVQVEDSEDDIKYVVDEMATKPTPKIMKSSGKRTRESYQDSPLYHSNLLRKRIYFSGDESDKENEETGNVSHHSQQMVNSSPSASIHSNRSDSTHSTDSPSIHSKDVDESSDSIHPPDDAHQEKHSLHEEDTTEMEETQVEDSEENGSRDDADGSGEDADEVADEDGNNDANEEDENVDEDGEHHESYADQQEDDEEEEDDEDDDDDDDEEEILDEESTEKYLQLVQAGKKFYSEKNFVKALEAFEKANGIWNADERLTEFISKLHRKLNGN